MNLAERPEKPNEIAEDAVNYLRERTQSLSA